MSTPDITPGTILGRLKDEGITSRDLADTLGVDPSHIGHIINCRRQSDRVLRYLARRLDIDYKALKKSHERRYRDYLRAQAAAA